MIFMNMFGTQKRAKTTVIVIIHSNYVQFGVDDNIL